jgi:Plasmid replication region DNA-binding N-term
MSTESTPAATHDDDDAPAALAARRAPRISQADVFRAADELLVQGDRPTIDRVRMRMGRGSPNTINDHLDAWWTKLGARLRDLPGHEFPQLPERVAHTLQQLWNEALDEARAALQDTLHEREQALLAREQALKARSQQLGEREQGGAIRAAALEESVALAREQLSAANRRADNLEVTLEERDRECYRLRSRIEALDASCADLRGKIDAAAASHQTERTKLQEQYTAAEARWLMEVDRARQVAKETAREFEWQVKELRGQIGPLQTERDHLRQELIVARSDLKTATAVREQLEERLRVMKNPPVRSSRNAGPQRKTPRKPKRPVG